jgi:hypothetical protein
MDEYIKILTFVVNQSEYGYDKKQHPQDLMHTVQTAAETVALTLIAYDQFKVNGKK